MSLLEWRDAYRIGIAGIDQEHSELIEDLNRLIETSLGGNGRGVARALGELHTRIAAHFALEERLMCFQGYAGYRAHKEDHERLLASLRDTMEKYERDRGTAAEALADTLAAWFMTHFREQDGRWHRSLASER